MAGFHGDKYYLDIIKAIFEQSRLQRVIETGTYEGDTTREFAKMAKFVDTIEIRPDFREKALKDSQGIDNITFWLGSSKDLIANVIRLINEDCLIFLDAHWQDAWPLHDELNIINYFREDGRKFIVIIDDFQHPNRSNFYGSNGGGGTIGDERYGPRTKLDNTPCDISTFGKYLKSFRELWFPCYNAIAAGFVIASDFTLNLSPNTELLTF